MDFRATGVQTRMRVAIIGEDEAACARMADVLLEGGASCHFFTGTRSFLNNLPRDSFDACILDSRASGRDCSGFLLALEERRQLLPVLVLADEEGALELVSQLDGRHDFLLKPVRPTELRARLAALVRRATPGSTRDEVFEYDRFSFDLKTLEVRDNGTAVELTQKEFQLAMLLLSNIGKPLSRAHIRESVWGRGGAVSHPGYACLAGAHQAQPAAGVRLPARAGLQLRLSPGKPAGGPQRGGERRRRNRRAQPGLRHRLSTQVAVRAASARLRSIPRTPGTRSRGRPLRDRAV